MDDAAVRQVLLRRVAERRTAVQRWLRRNRARSNRLAVTGIVAGAIGAAATAGPGLGGPAFTDSVGRSLDLAYSSAVWQPLCLLAMVVSLVSAVTAGLLRHFDLSSRVGAAEAALVELDSIRTLLEVDRIPVVDALNRFQQASGTVPFVDHPDGDEPLVPPPPPRPSTGPPPRGPQATTVLKHPASRPPSGPPTGPPRRPPRT